MKNARLIWARFCDLENEKPLFCDRDGIKRGRLDITNFEYCVCA